MKTIEGHGQRNPSGELTQRQIRRDYIATAAMMGFIMQRQGSDEDDRSLGFVAQLSFRMAEAMLAEADRRELDDDIS